MIWEACCRAAVRRCRCRVRGPGVRRAGLPVVRAGRLRPWAAGGPVIRLRGGAGARLRPRRGRCGSCQATHVLLPSWMASQRANTVGVIAAAGVASALHGTGGAVGADLGVPAATVRGWLRRLRARAGAMRQDAMVIFGCLTAGCDAPYPEPSGSALGDALSAVAACAHAAITFCGRRRGLGAAAGPVRPGPLPRPGTRQLTPRARPGSRMPAGGPRRSP